MAEILTEKGICDSCGSALRKGSAFCYSCGEAIVVEAPLPPPILKPATGTLEGYRNGGPNGAQYTEPELPPVPAPVSEPLVTSTRVAPPPHGTEQNERRPQRNRKQKTVEVEWVQQTPSAAGFLIAAIVLAAIAIGFVMAAYYLK